MNKVVLNTSPNRFFVLLFMVLFCFGAKVHALENGSFEQGLFGWTVSGSDVKVNPYGGNASNGTNFVALGTADQGGATLSQTFPVLSGTNVISFDFYVNGDPGRTGIVQAQVFTANTNLVSQTFTNAASNTGTRVYQTKTLVFVIPPGISSVTLRFSDLSPSSGVAVDPLIDNVKLEPNPSTPAPSFVNGSFEQGLKGWTVNSSSIIISPYVPASEGTNCIELGAGNIAGSVLSQTFAITGGATRQLNFDILALGDPGRTGIVQVELSFSPPGSPISQLFTNAARNTLPFIYQTKSIPFTVPVGATAMTLKFIDLSPFSGVAVDPIIDNIRFNSGEPTITTQPVDKLAVVGSVVEFSVTAEGAQPLAFQWHFDGTAIPGATNTTLVLQNVQLTNSGVYSVRVTGLGGFTVSSNANLNVAFSTFINGSFEQGLLGWTANRATIYNAASYGGAASSGTNFAVLGAGNLTEATLSQTFSIIPNTRYSLVFDISANGDPGRTGITRAELLSSSAILFAQNFTNAANNTLPRIYQTKNLIFTAPHGVTNLTLKFSDISPSSGIAVDPIIDNVRIIRNRPPTAFAQSLLLNEDQSLSIVLSSVDPDGNPLSYSIGTPTNGVISGVAPNLTYHPNANYFGADSFTFTVNDGEFESPAATISLAILSVNDAPVAVPRATPAFLFSTNEISTVIISPNGTNAIVILDGSLSTDVENDPLQFLWIEGTNVVSAGAVTTNILNVGTHNLTLVVNDGADNGFDSLIVEVITPAGAVAELAAFLDASTLLPKRKQPLSSTLSAAIRSLSSQRSESGINQLEAFARQVEAQVRPVDSKLADDLLNILDEILAAMDPFLL